MPFYYYYFIVIIIINGLLFSSFLKLVFIFVRITPVESKGLLGLKTVSPSGQM